MFINILSYIFTIYGLNRANQTLFFLVGNNSDNTEVTFGVINRYFELLFLCVKYY